MCLNHLLLPNVLLSRRKNNCNFSARQEISWVKKKMANTWAPFVFRVIFRSVKYLRDAYSTKSNRYTSA